MNKTKEEEKVNKSTFQEQKVIFLNECGKRNKEDVGKDICIQIFSNFMYNILIMYFITF